MSLKLKDLNERVQKFSLEFEEQSQMEEEIIEEDVNNLKELFIEKIEEYFEGLKKKLKASFYEQNAELKESLVEGKKILKEELLNVINEAEFFDKNKFFVEFDTLKRDSDEFERFLKDYLNNEKTIQFTQNMDENIRKLSPVFHSGYTIDDKMSKYVLNIEKLDTKAANAQEDHFESIIDRFIKSNINHIDSHIKKCKHFTKSQDGSPAPIDGFNNTHSNSKI